MFKIYAKDEEIPCYLTETISSQKRAKHKILPPIQSSRTLDIDDFHKSGSEMSDDADDSSSENNNQISDVC